MFDRDKVERVYQLLRASVSTSTSFRFRTRIESVTSGARAASRAVWTARKGDKK